MTRITKRKPLIESFNFSPGRILAKKYRVLEILGAGYEGEVYRVMELGTGIERAAKFFFPHRNRRNATALRYAKLLHDLAACPIIIHYHTYENMTFRGEEISFLVSEYVDGELLSALLNRQPGKRIGVYRGLQLLHALAAGLESMHNMKTYHGDLHSDNVIIKRYGLGFELKLLDMYNFGKKSRENVTDDIIDSIHIFHEAIGGRKHYAKHPPEVKAICCGLKRSLITAKFKTAAQLRDHLENIDWQSSYRESR